MATTNLAETKLRTYSSSKWHFNETQPVCKTTIYWATKYAQIIKNKPFWHQSGQQAKKNETYPAKPTYTVLGQPTNPRIRSVKKQINPMH